MSNDFMTAVKDRRTYYGISKETAVSNERIVKVIEHAVTYAPSAFNSQSARVVLLLREQHDKLWNITKDTLRKIIVADKFASTDEKINSFRNGYGTILFFEDQSIIKGLQQKFPLYADNFPIWSQQSSGMLQYIIWTALEIEEFGVSLQHYNPIIDDQVKQEWNIPDEWSLIAQMPFGKPTALPNNKDIMPLVERIKIFE